MLPLLRVLPKMLAAASITFALGTVAPAPARAADIFTLDGGALVALFNSVDVSGCVSTSVLVDAGENTQQNPPANPQPTSANGAFVSIFQFNNCTFDFLFGSGFNDTSVTVAVGGALKTGSLSGSMQVCGADSSGPLCFPISIDLAWIGTGDLDRLNEVTQYKSGNTVIVVHSNAMARSATSQGAVSSGSTNFTPSASTTAFIEFALEQQVTVD
jgi:hypothetical protein